MRLTLNIAGDLRAPMTARRAVSAFAEHLPPRAVETLALVVNELVTNALLHVCMDGEPIYLEVDCEEGRVWGHVGDPGNGFDAPTTMVDQAALSGRGLILVDQLTSRWGVEAAPTTRVWFEIDGNVMDPGQAGEALTG